MLSISKAIAHLWKNFPFHLMSIVFLKAKSVSCLAETAKGTIKPRHRLASNIAAQKEAPNKKHSLQLLTCTITFIDKRLHVYDSMLQLDALSLEYRENGVVCINLEINRIPVICKKVRFFPEIPCIRFRL